MSERQAIARISPTVMHAWDISPVATDLYGQLHLPGALERLTQKLLLSEYAIAIASVFYRGAQGYWELFLESPTFEEIGEGEALPLLRLDYARIWDDIELVRIHWVGAPPTDAVQALSPRL